LEDWELRIYRQMWARAKQFWTAPQFIRVTDDENAPKFVGLNMPKGQPMQDGDGNDVEGPPQIDQDGRSAFGYKNTVAEMDIDIEVDSQPANASVQQEAFNELMHLVSSSPVYQQQIPLSMLIQLSPIPHKRSMMDAIKQASDQQAQANAQQQQIGMATAQAKLGEIQAKTAEMTAKVPLHGATGFAKTLDALTYSHAAHSDHIAQGLEAGISHEQAQQARDHQAAMQESAQSASANQAETDQGGQ
jgi:hypothetical protein